MNNDTVNDGREGATIGDDALAAQVATRLLAEGAVSATARGAAVAFDGATREARPDLSPWHALRIVHSGQATVRQVGDSIEIDTSYRMRWRCPALLALGAAALIPTLFIRPNGPAAAAILAALLSVSAVQHVVARLRFSRWLNSLARQERSLLEHHATQRHLAGPSQPTPD